MRGIICETMYADIRPTSEREDFAEKKKQAVFTQLFKQESPTENPVRVNPAKRSAEEEIAS